MNVFRIIGLLALATSAPACGARGLAASHAASYATIFARERVRPDAGERSQPTPGLDSQEAAIVSGAYRASLAPKGTKIEEEPVLILPPQGRDQKKGTAP